MHLLQYPPSPFLLLAFRSSRSGGNISLHLREVGRDEEAAVLYWYCVSHSSSVYLYLQSSRRIWKMSRVQPADPALALSSWEAFSPTISYYMCRVPSAMLPTKSSICWDQIGPSSIRIRIRVHSYIVKLSLCSQSSPELRMTSNKYTYDTSSDGSSAISFELLKNCGTAHARIIVPNTINSAIQLAFWGNVELLYQGKLRLRQVCRNSKLSHHNTWVTCPAADLVSSFVLSLS